MKILNKYVILVAQKSKKPFGLLRHGRSYQLLGYRLMGPKIKKLSFYNF